MKISKLDLTSFKSFAGETFDLRAPRTFIAGLNGAGKTSLRESIRYALTGKAQGLDGKGSGVDNLVPTFGGDSVSVSAWIDGLGSVTRTWFKGQSSLEVQGFAGSPTEQQTALYEKLGTSDAFLQAVLDTSVFLHLHHAEAKALVLAMLNVRINVDANLFPTMDPGESLYVELSLEQIDAAYAKAFEDRKAAKQRVKGAFVPPKPIPPETSVDLAAIETRLKELRAKLTDEQQAVAGTLGQKAVLDRQLVEALTQKVVPSVPDDLAAQVEALEERLSVMEADVQPVAQSPALGIAIDKDPAHIRMHAERLMAFNPKDGCVLDTGIPCPAHKLKFTNRGKDLLDKLPAEEPPVPVVAPAPNPMTAVRKELDRLKGLKADHEAAVHRNQAQADLEQQIREQLTALPDVSDAQARIAKIQESIQKGEAIQKAAQAYHASLSAFEQASQHKQTLDAEVARLEALVTLLGPSGARVQALGDALGRFEASVNVSLVPFGWEVHFDVNPWQVVVNGRPVETYSRSEQHRIGIALQVAIAELSGLGFAVVDELDMLDGKNRETMGVVLLRSPLDQVLILGTREADSALPKGSVALTAYRIQKQDGKSVIVERSAA